MATSGEEADKGDDDGEDEEAMVVDDVGRDEGLEDEECKVEIMWSMFGVKSNVLTTFPTSTI